MSLSLSALMAGRVLYLQALPIYVMYCILYRLEKDLACRYRHVYAFFSPPNNCVTDCTVEYRSIRVLQNSNPRCERVRNPIIGKTFAYYSAKEIQYVACMRPFGELFGRGFPSPYGRYKQSIKRDKASETVLFHARQRND